MTPLLLLLVALQDAAPAAESVPTFTEHVAAVVHARCTSCHRPGEAGPFPLRTYREVAKRGSLIAWVVEENVMPPWHPVEGHGAFKDGLALTEAQRATLLAWIDGGMPEGDPAKMPPLPEFPDGWQLGTPDLVVEMATGFEVPAAGPDIYRNFVLPLGLERDRWLTAIEVRPSARSVLHHIVFGLDSKGEARALDGDDGRPGWDAMTGRGGGSIGRGDGGPFLGTGLGGWAVGSQARHLPMGLARELPAGSDLILRSHFHPSGKVEVERTTIGLYFTDRVPERTLVGLQMPPIFGTAAGIDVPPGETDFRIRDEFTLPVDVQALTVGGHAHYILREMHVWTTPPKGERASVFFIDDWDFDWQNRYEWQEPLELVAGTKVEVELVYDNGADNPNNPFDPPRRIRWGLQSTDEMGSVTVAMVAKDPADTRKLARAISQYKSDRLRRRSRDADRREQRQMVRMLLADRVRQLDADGDGELSKDELAGRASRIARRADTNGDGALSRKELEAALGKDALPPLRSVEGEDADDHVTMVDLDGVEHHPLVVADGVRAHVLVFTTVDCPIANGYAPEIAAIVREHAKSALRFYLVHVDPDVTSEAARRHADEFSYPLPVLRDTSRALVLATGVTHTPEVAVVLPDGGLAYRGRIDDQYREIGRRRPRATTFDLRDALRAVLAGESPATPRTTAVGCPLPEADIRRRAPSDH